MTYHSTGNNNGNQTVLVSSRGYADLGAVDLTSAGGYCGPKFGVTSPFYQPCIQHYMSGRTDEYKPPGAAPGAPSSGGGVLSTIGTLLGGAASAYAASKQPQMPYGGFGMPFGPTGPSPITMIAVVGGIGLLAVLLMRRPRGNPSRRRRRHHARRRRHSRRR